VVTIGEETEQAQVQVCVIQKSKPFSGFHSLWPTYSTNLARVSMMTLDDLHKSFKYYTWYLQIIPEITSYLRNTKQNSHLSNIYFKLVPLFKFALLPATVKLLKTFLEFV
jgi:hypothetical protein